MYVVYSRLLGKETLNNCMASDEPWTMKHAHLLQMGGFKIMCMKNETYEGTSWFRSHWKALNRDYAYQSRFGGEMWVGVLSFRKFKSLLSSQKLRFPNVTEEEINDRSKGDALSKGVALLQITWFIMQLLARARQGLVITELELTTAALAGLNSVMYLFWWSKPLDIQCPIITHSKKAEALLKERLTEAEETQWTFPMVEDDSGRQVPREDFCLKEYLWSEFIGTVLNIWATLSWNTCAFFRGVLRGIRKCISILLPCKTSTGSCEPVSCTDSVVEIVEAELDHEGKEVVYNLEEKKFVVIQERRLDIASHQTDSHTAITSVPIRTIEWVWRLVTTRLLYLPYLFMFLPMHKILDTRLRIRDFKLQEFRDAKHKIQDKPSLRLLFDEQDMKWIMSMIFFSEHVETKPLLCFSAIAGATFGSIHCAAWNSPFPSHTEQVFWRTASLSLVGICLCILIGPLVRELTLTLFFKAKDGTKAKSFWDIVDERVNELIVSKPVHLFLSVAYPLARLSLLILALLSLRNLPESALESVTWTNLIPHI